MSYAEGQDSERASEEDHERQSKKKDLSLLGKKKESKKEKKDRGYVMFDEEDSDESLVVSEDIKSPSKMKKSKPFKFPSKKSKEKDEKKDKDGKKEEKDKEKKKEEKEGKKHKIKGDKKKSKHGHLHSEPPQVIGESDKPIFGVPLTLAVERNKCHDGIELPFMFRECIDYIEEHGLSCEGIYRISGVKSKVQFLKDCYNKHLPVYLEEYEPNIVASLLKTFLRELPEPVLTTSMMPKFEEASVIKSEKKRVEQFLKLIDDLPACNKQLLSWMIVHMKHVIERQKENKMSLQNVSIVLSPTMQISHRVLNILFSHVKQLFKDVELKKYKPPMKPTTSRWSLELPDNPVQLEEELAKQESLLSALHAELNTGITDQDKEEQLWEVQRIVTQLKRKIKFAKKSVDAAEKRRKEKEEKRPMSVAEEDELRLELREVPTKRQAPPPPTKTTNQKEVVEVHISSNQVSDNKEDVVEKKPTEEMQPDKISNESEQVITKTETEVQAVDKNVQESQNIETTADELERTEIVAEEKERVQEETKEDVSATDKVSLEEKQQNDSVKVEMEVVPEKPDEVDEKKVQSELKDQVKEETAVGDSEGVAETREEESADEMIEKRGSFIESQTEDDEVGANYEDHFEQQVEDILEKVKGVKESSEESENESKDTVKQFVEPATEIKPIPEIPKPLAVSSNMNEFVSNGQLPVGDGDTDQLAEFKESLGVQDEEPPVYEPIDEEIQALQEEQLALQLEEEELLAIERELRTKIETEKNETDRLQQEITELQYLRQDSDLEEFSSSSESSYESEDEEDLQEILNQLLSENEKLERENTELCQKIHEERMICLEVKVQIRVLQQKHLGNSLGSEGFIERDLMIF